MEAMALVRFMRKRGLAHTVASVGNKERETDRERKRETYRERERDK
jgi:hypothetical protein